MEISGYLPLSLRRSKVSTKSIFDSSAGKSLAVSGNIPKQSWCNFLSAYSPPSILHRFPGHVGIGDDHHAHASEVEAHDAPVPLR